MDTPQSEEDDVEFGLDPLDVVEHVLSAENLTFDRTEDGDLAFVLTGDWKDYELWFAWRPEADCLQLCLSLDMRASKAKRATAYELLSLINQRVWIGHFEVWADDGEVVFRHAMPLPSGERPTLAQAASMIDAAVEAADRFYPAFDFLLKGSRSPQDAMAACMFETVGEAWRAAMTPILLLGVGRMGGALIEGWAKAGAFAAVDLILRDPFPGEAARAAADNGARLNPPDATLSEAPTVVLAVKPQIWREVAAEVAPLLHPGAVIVSIAAGVGARDLWQAFEGRAAVRIMPTTAVAIAKGAASIFAETQEARARAHRLFDPVATTVDIEDEGLMDATVGVSGSAPAYLYAFIEALEAAGEAQGLPAETSRKLARATIAGAAALLEAGGGEPSELRRQVTSPGGTTEAALKVLMGEGGLHALLAEAVAAAVRRSRELG